MLAGTFAYTPWKPVQETLTVLIEQFPGQEQELVSEIKILVSEGMKQDLARLERERREREDYLSLANHVLIETFEGVSENADCQNAVLSYQNKGYREVMWTLDKDEDNHLWCEVWGIPPGKSKK